MAVDLQLQRPLVVFDIESTGVYPKSDRIVELAVLKIFPDGRKEPNVRRLNPGIPIPKTASDIHGITDEDVKDCPKFADIAERLSKYLENCDLAGYNIISFDVPMLEAEFKRAGFNFKVEDHKIIDAYNIFCKLHSRTLTAAYKFFCGKDLEGAHGAAADTDATYEVLLGELAMHPDQLTPNVDFLSEFSNALSSEWVDRTRRFRWNGDEVVLNFGSKIGTPLRELAKNDTNYLKWIISANFTDEVKTIASNALVGKFPERKKSPENATP